MHKHPSLIHPWTAHDTTCPERRQTFLAVIAAELDRILTAAGADCRASMPAL